MAVQNAVDKRQESLEEATAQLRNAQDESSAAGATLSAARSQLTKQERQLADSRDQLRRGLQSTSETGEVILLCVQWML